jgi:hypothetical protein
VPATAVVTFAGVEKVLTVKDNQTAEIRVTTGRRLGAQVEVVSGIKANQPVVVHPGNLTGGQAISVER